MIYPLRYIVDLENLLINAYWDAKIGVDTEENEPPKVCGGNIQYSFAPLGLDAATRQVDAALSAKDRSECAPDRDDGVDKKRNKYDSYPTCLRLPPFL